MSNDTKRNVIITFSSKIAILLLNFFIVTITARLWGAEGRGLITLFATDLSMIAIFTNVFTSSSTSYYISKLGRNKLMSQAYLITFFIAAVIAAILSFTKDTANLSVILFFTASLLGLITFHNSLFIGKQKINYFNLITILQPLLHLGFMMVYHYIFQKIGIYNHNGCFAYFYGQMTSLFVIIILCHILTRKVTGEPFKLQIDKYAIKQSFNFGWQTELSNLLQLFNYRLSYYFLDALSGLGSVGIFSIGVTISEAIWTLSKSISVVQYSNVLKKGDSIDSRRETSRMALISFVASTACMGILLLIPQQFFAWIFGPQFIGVKRVLLLMAPGVLAIAASNVFGNYFSAIGKLKILIAKSAIGLIITILLSIFLIPRFDIDGACIVNSSSYIISSIILIIWFKRLK